MRSWIAKCVILGSVFVFVGLLLWTLAFQLLSKNDVEDETPTPYRAYVRFQALLILSWVSFMVALFGCIYYFQDEPSSRHPAAYLALTGTFTFLSGKSWSDLRMFGMRLTTQSRNMLFFFYFAAAVAMGGLLTAFMIDDEISSVCVPNYDCFIVSGKARPPIRANCTSTPSVSPPKYFDCRRLIQFSLQRLGTSVGTLYGIFCTTIRVINVIMYVVSHSSNRTVLPRPNKITDHHEEDETSRRHSTTYEQERLTRDQTLNHDNIMSINNNSNDDKCDFVLVHSLHDVPTSSNWHDNETEWILFFATSGLALALVATYLSVSMLTDVIQHPGFVGMFFSAMCMLMIGGLAGTALCTLRPCCRNEYIQEHEYDSLLH
eukprot:gene2186-5202_t